MLAMLDQRTQEPASERQCFHHIRVSIGQKIGVVRRQCQSFEAHRPLRLKASQLAIDVSDVHGMRSRIEICEALRMLFELVSFQRWGHQPFQDRGDCEDDACSASESWILSNCPTKRRTPTKKADKAENEIDSLVQPCVHQAELAAKTAIEGGFVEGAFVGHSFSSEVGVRAVWGSGAEELASDVRPGCTASEMPWFLLRRCRFLWIGVRKDSSSGRGHGISFARRAQEVPA